MRKVFFSFHYDDIWRVNQVRNMGVVNNVGFKDEAEFEAVKRKGEQAVRNWIDKQMQGTGVTVVLIGSSTHNREFVHYEIEQSIKSNKGIIGIHINQLKDQRGKTKNALGRNPLDWHKIAQPSFFEGIRVIKAADYYKTYKPSGFGLPGLILLDAYDEIKNNIQDWVEKAATQVGR